MDPFIAFLLILTCIGVAALASGPIASRAAAMWTGKPISLAQGFRFGLGYAVWIFIVVVISGPILYILPLALPPLMGVLNRAMIPAGQIIILFTVLQIRMTRAYERYLHFDRPAARRLALLQNVVFLVFCVGSAGLVILMIRIVGQQ
jgi:hypothetical protein